MDISYYSYFIKVSCAFVMIFVCATSSQNTRCPFEYLYHFGDGVTDVGNSILVLPWGPSLPAARSPYGRTFPGWPTGRWGDGLIDFDYAAAEFGFPHITPSLSSNASSSNGVIFSVARSPVLDHTFFKSRGVKIPPYAVPLSVQLSWFKAHLKSVCTSPTDCANRLGNSLILLGDIEANDVGYSLIQGKSIREVRTYVSYITEAQISATRLTIISYVITGPFGNTTLQACCGIGGKYNYNSRRFCGSRGVPVCSNPNNYIFWDGLHMTQEASLRIVRILIQPALSTLNCAT
ncbi:GDSL-like Lipase/Acylhydrolase superfamily protein [Striga asiatica]|uniref:GDSL-like Lipase/Acylhydrolase superfamily protein n=1 Tax=Striga asiatica TaxID=4170 RepID=A0A5A7QH71_STRAF|nr:GDSL-like Lipase/Acylhydrolase superfamily protein [Striga asiatica]